MGWCEMTVQEAYAAGFCKAAEAAGVDPRAVVQSTIAKMAMDKDAHEYDASPRLRNLLPGVAAYNYRRRLASGQ